MFVPVWVLKWISETEPRWLRSRFRNKSVRSRIAQRGMSGRLAFGTVHRGAILVQGRDPRLAYGNAHGPIMTSMPEEALDSARWRSFRSFLLSLEDAELQGTFEQLQAEMMAREEQERHIMRLLFSSLVTADLERAREEILREQAERVEDLRIVAMDSAASERRPTATVSPGTGQGSAGPDEPVLHGSRQDGLDTADRIACCSPSQIP